MRGPAKSFALAVVFGLLVLAHYVVEPLLDWRAGADFLVIAVLLVAVRVRPGVAALVGFATGLMVDTFSPLGFGSAMMAGTLVAFGASWLKAAFFAENLVLNAAFLMVGKLAFDAVHLGLERRVQGGELLRQLTVWSPLSALVTAVIGLALLIVLRPVVQPDEPRW